MERKRNKTVTHGTSTLMANASSLIFSAKFFVYPINQPIQRYYKKEVCYGPMCKFVEAWNSCGDQVFLKLKDSKWMEFFNYINSIFIVCIQSMCITSYISCIQFFYNTAKGVHAVLCTWNPHCEYSIILCITGTVFHPSNLFNAHEWMNEWMNKWMNAGKEVFQKSKSMKTFIQCQQYTQDLLFSLFKGQPYEIFHVKFFHQTTVLLLVPSERYPQIIDIFFSNIVAAIFKV